MLEKVDFVNKIEKKNFTDERSLFKAKDLIVEKCCFDVGESPLKESSNIHAIDCTFNYKYPFWYSKSVIVDHCKFNKMARSGVWYGENLVFKNVDSIAPKTFRRCKNVKVINSKFNDSSEAFWNCKNLIIENTYFKGDYIFMNSSNIKISDSTIDGNYCFDGGSNIEVRNCILSSKDSFWNCKNVSVYDSTIEGEYIGWNSKNIIFHNCKIKSHQGFCYIKNLVIKDSEINESDLIFEFCEDVDVDVKGHILSILNPTSGIIKYEECDEIIINDEKSTVRVIRK